jgi:DNA primase
MAVTPRTLVAIKAAPLSDLIKQTGGRLKRVGREFLTQCLWHDDANPSLTVSDDKGFCYCHVCRGGGDAIDYVGQRYGLSWREAAEKAADILGVQLETDDENPEETARRIAARKAEISQLVVEQDKYSANLRDARAKRVKQIWIDRGLTKEAALEFGAGFAPDGFFAGRITLPIYNHRNELVGWAGRATKSKEEQPAKYKNSADSDLFQKKLLVFNEVRAKEAAREAGSIVFVEGHLDVVSMWQAGIRNVVALQGTGTPDPLVLKRLAKASKNFVLCFDGDAGGRKAAEYFIASAGPMALAGELNVTVATLPDGQDPDEVIRSGGDLYGYLASAPSWLDWVIDTWAAALDKEDTAMVTDVENKLHGLIDGLRSKALRTHYIDKAARVLSTTEKEAEKLAKDWGNREFFHAADTWRPRTPAETRLAAEKRLVRLYLHRQGLRSTLQPLLERVSNPALLWLSKQLTLLNEYCDADLTPHSAMAIVAVAEPHYMQQLRTLVRPNVVVDEAPGVLAHLATIMEGEVLSSPDESDPDQPSA